jgi:hypothetical protein
MNPVSENQAPARLVPDEPFPPYRFVPGVSPHPTGDPAGHSFGKESPTPPPLDPQQWEVSKPYLYGIDLFNAQYYWESHVAWESLWLACGRKGTIANFLKGLIKLAAAGVKHGEGTPQGVQSHARRAAELWHDLARSLGTGTDLFLGLRLRVLIGLAETVCRDGWPEEPPILVPVRGEPDASQVRPKDR